MVELHGDRGGNAPSTRKGMMRMAKTLTAKELAEKLGTDGRTVRKFLRSDARSNGSETPGKGPRWVIEANQVRSLQKRFDAWNAARAEKVEEGSEQETETADA